ncbi:MAG: hypothetical protein IPO70_04195 [Bacteroidetes bacterium]|nr:hypothetical protein [Bacteroidota bacterium]
MKIDKKMSHKSSSNNLLYFIVFCCIVLVVSCKHYPLNMEELTPTSSTTLPTSNQNLIPCDSDSVYFSTTILPLFTSNCAKAGCHDPITHEEGFVFNSYTGILSSGEITPGNPAKGDIMKTIKSTDPNKIMPPPGNTPLTAQQITWISKWISQGAKNNYCNSCDTSNVTYTTKVKPFIDLKCKGCHNSGNAPNGINLETYTSCVAAAQSGALLGSIKHQAPYSNMPKGGQKLPACEIDIINNWINLNYPQ